MGQGKDDRKKGSALGTAAVATASVALGYAALELGLGGVLKPGRDAIKDSLEPQDDAVARHQQQQGPPELVTEVDHDVATRHQQQPGTPELVTEVGHDAATREKELTTSLQQEDKHH